MSLKRRLRSPGSEARQAGLLWEFQPGFMNLDEFRRLKKEVPLSQIGCHVTCREASTPVALLRHMIPFSPEVAESLTGARD